MLLGVAAAVVVFLGIAGPSGVLRMADPDYCFDHPHRPRGTTSHDESLSLFPPGPVCTFTTSAGEEVAGPGWWPAVAAAAAVVAGGAVAAVTGGRYRPPPAARP